MSGRGAQREDVVADSGQNSQAKSLWTRLNSHASGRRAGDQFNVYICDRFIVPALTAVQQRDTGAGIMRANDAARVPWSGSAAQTAGLPRWVSLRI
jgi:hypothetical protein